MTIRSPDEAWAAAWDAYADAPPLTGRTGPPGRHAAPFEREARERRGPGASERAVAGRRVRENRPLPADERRQLEALGHARPPAPGRRRQHESSVMIRKRLRAGRRSALARSPSRHPPPPPPTRTPPRSAASTATTCPGDCSARRSSSTPPVGRTLARPFAHRIVNLRQGSTRPRMRTDADQVGFLNDFCTRYPAATARSPHATRACTCPSGRRCSRPRP
jgi:hypothetical protein